MVCVIAPARAASAVGISAAVPAPGVGSVLALWPAAPPAAAALAVQPATAPQEAVATGPVLVVDDDEAILEIVTTILEAEGYPVQTATNGAEALALVERARPSLVLLDMRMPVLDGWGFARELRARGVQLPILVMTAAQDARRWADEIGADGYLAKPFDLLHLLDAVQRLS